MDQATSWSMTPGMAPPTAEMPTPPVAVAERGGRVAEATEQRRGGRIRRAAIAAGITVLAAATTVAYAVTRNHDAGENMFGDRMAQAGSIEGTEYDACVDGMFPEGDFQASLEVSTPGDLHRAPESSMGDARNLTDYFFGKDGVACESAATLATIKQGYIQMLGEGASNAFGFVSFGTVKEQIDIYQNDKEAAQKDADMMAGLMEANSKLNDTEIVSSFYQVKGVKVGEEVEPRLEKVDVNFAKESVFITVLANDGNFENVQIMAIDRESGQIYLLHSNGTIPEMTEDEKKAQEENQDDQTGGGSADEESQGGGDNADEHNGDNNGCEGGCGEGGTDQGTGTGPGNGGGEGGGCGTGQCGGCGSCNPGPTTPGIGGPNPTTPPVTQPPVTTPPVTQPPVTVPPSTLPPKDPPSTLPTPPTGY